MTIPFTDLGAQYHRLKFQIDRNIQRVLEHGKYIMGPEVFELEEQLADFAGTRDAVTCSSGTDALLMPLMAWGIGPGDAVFTTPFTFVATAEVISLLGATPVFVDIDEATFNIDPEKLEQGVRAIKAEGELQPRAIIPVDIFGLPADYHRIQQTAEQHGLKVLEDAAQSFGASLNGRMAGSFGDAAATSFFPSKPLGCYGDGGAILTNDEQLADTLRSIRVHGQGQHKYENIRVGLNARLDTLQAAVLLAKLPVFSQEIERRNRVADYYREQLPTALINQSKPDGAISAWAQYSVLMEARDERLQAINKLGIPTAIYYPKPLHRQSALRDSCKVPNPLPIAEAVCGKIFSLPMSPDLSEAQISEIAARLKSLNLEN